LFNDRVATCDDMDGITLVKLWTAVVVLCRDLGEAEIDIDLSEGMGRIEDVFSGLDGDIGSQLREQFTF